MWNPHGRRKEAWRDHAHIVSEGNRQATHEGSELAKPQPGEIDDSRRHTALRRFGLPPRGILQHTDVAGLFCMIRTNGFCPNPVSRLAAAQQPRGNAALPRFPRPKPSQLQPASRARRVRSPTSGRFAIRPGSHRPKQCRPSHATDERAKRVEQRDRRRPDLHRAPVHRAAADTALKTKDGCTVSAILPHPERRGLSRTRSPRKAACAPANRQANRSRAQPMTAPTK